MNNTRTDDHDKIPAWYDITARTRNCCPRRGCDNRWSRTHIDGLCKRHENGGE